MLRGEVWWAKLRAPMGERPILLISRDEAYQKRRSATIIPITTRIRGIPVEVRVGSREGLPRESVINADDITTVRLSTLERRVGTLSPEKMRQVDEAIQFALALPDYK